MDKNTIAIGIDHGWANMKTVHAALALYDRTKRGVKACYGCQGSKECDTFLFLSGNFRCKDDGDSQGIRIKSFVVLLGKSVYNGK